MSHLFRVISKPDKRKVDQSTLSDFLSLPSCLSHHQQGSTQYLYIAPVKWFSKDFPLCLQAIQKKKKKKEEKRITFGWKALGRASITETIQLWSKMIISWATR